MRPSDLLESEAARIQTALRAARQLEKRHDPLDDLSRSFDAFARLPALHRCRRSAHRSSWHRPTFEAWTTDCSERFALSVFALHLGGHLGLFGRLEGSEDLMEAPKRVIMSESLQSHTSQFDDVVRSECMREGTSRKNQRQSNTHTHTQEPVVRTARSSSSFAISSEQHF